MPAPVLLEQFAATATTGGFSPSDIASLVGWWDASDTATITDTVSAVSAWADKSSEGNDLIQATGALQPSTGTRTINGLNVLHYPNPGPAHLKTLAFSYPSVNTGTIFAVVEVDAIAFGDGRIAGMSGATGSDYDGADRIAWLTTGATTHYTYGNNAMRADIARTMTTPVQLTARRNGDTVQLWKDGTLGAAYSGMGTTAFATPRFIVGDGLTSGSTGGGPFHGALAEVILYSDALSDPDCELVEAYLMAKWGVGTFSPYDLPGLVAWYDASAAGTITESGGAVSAWADLSGNGYDLTQSTGGNKPTTGSRTIGGLNALDFDGTTDVMESTQLANATSRTVLAVVETDDLANYRSVLSPYLPGGLNWGITNSGYQRILKGGVALIGSDATSVGTDPVNIGMANAEAGAWALYRNGVQTASGTSAVTYTAGRTTAVGANLADAPVEYWDGAIGELVITDSILSAGDLANWNGYVADKWGVWSPAMLPNLVDDWDPTDTASITESGGNVSQWDGSINGLSFVQATSANRPLTGTRTINSLNCIEFDPTSGSFSRSLNYAALNISQPFTMLCVYKDDIPGTQSFLTDDVSGGRAILAPTNSGNPVLFAGSFSTSTAANNTTAHQYVAVFNGASSALYQDGGANALTSSPGTNGLTGGITLGAADNGGAPCDGALGRFVLMTGVISDADRARWDAYCTAEWGL